MNNNMYVIDIDSIINSNTYDGRQAVGYLWDEIPYIEMFINNENYPIDNLPMELQKLVISARNKNNNQEESVIRHR